MRALAIDDATVIDGTGAPPRTHWSVLCVDGTIRAVGPRGAFRVPRDADTLPARGRFLMPGLVDLHTHMITRDAFRFLHRFGPWMKDGDPRRFLRWFPAFGVTTVRDIGNYRGILQLRNGVEEGRLVGPTILAAGGILAGGETLSAPSPAVPAPPPAAAEVRPPAAGGVGLLQPYARRPPRP